MSDGKRVNGKTASWGSLRLRINGEYYFGFTALAFSDKLEQVLGFGMGPHHGPRVRSTGKYTPDLCKLTGWIASVQEVRAALADLSDSGNSYAGIEFDVVGQYIVAGKDPITVEILDCTWAENNANHEENPDPLKEEIAFQPMKIKRNGKVLWDDSDGDPN